MTYFDDYKKRMLASGDNQSDAYKDSSAQLIKNTFNDSPSYKQVYVNNSLVDTHVLHGDKSDIKNLLFLPNVIYNIGSVVDIDTVKWLMTEFVDNEIFPKGEISKCNSTLKWKENDAVHDHPCIFYNSSITYDRLSSDDYMTLKTGQIAILVSENADTLNIKDGLRLIYKNEAWKVEFVDKTKDGILNIVVSNDVIRDGDDLANRIADNSQPNSTNNTAPSEGNLW